MFEYPDSGEVWKIYGNSSNFGHSKKAVFEEVRRNNEAKLTGWAEQFLFAVGKETIIKAMAMAMLNFTKSCFKLPIFSAKRWNN